MYLLPSYVLTGLSLHPPSPCAQGPSPLCGVDHRAYMEEQGHFDFPEPTG